MHHDHPGGRPRLVEEWDLRQPPSYNSQITWKLPQESRPRSDMWQRKERHQTRFKARPSQASSTNGETGDLVLGVTFLVIVVVIGAVAMARYYGDGKRGTPLR